MSIALSGESTIDLTPELLKKYDIHTRPFHIEMGDKSLLDGDKSNQELFDFTERTGIMCKTSALNINELEEHFAQLLKTYDYIIHFTISSGLSSGYNNAMAASHGNPKIHVVDSQVVSTGIALLAIYARELIDSKLYSYEEIISKVEARVPFLVCGFQLDRLDYLYKGGRCSRLSVIGANILRLKPEIVCSEGKFIVGRKFRGPVEKTVMLYVDDLLSNHSNIDLKLACTAKSTLDPALENKVKERLLDFGFQNVINVTAGATNGYHAGPNVIGVHFLNDGPHPVPTGK